MIPAISVSLATVVLALTRAGARAWLDHWAPLAEWFVAGATLLLAMATFVLAKRAHQEAKAVSTSTESIRRQADAVAEQVRIEADQLVASTRPLVVPILGDNFARERYRQSFSESPEDAEQALNGPHVRLRNAGAGPALNTRGSLWWTPQPDDVLQTNAIAGGASDLHPLVLAAGEEEWARVLGEGVSVNWTSAVGYLRYHDLGGEEWQTHFRFRVDGSGNIHVEILAAGRSSELGEPAYNAQGWVNRPESVTLWSRRAVELCGAAKGGV